MKSITILLPIFATCSFCVGFNKPVPLENKIEINTPYPQEMQQQYSTTYLAQAHVKERITWDVTEADSAKIAIDRYDAAGHKIEAIEYYEGKRKLEKFIDGKWTKINSSTRFTFSYDKEGRQIEQRNHNFDPEQRNQMYRYDRYGNIERWIIGRSFQLSALFTCAYDERNSIVYEYDCWEEGSCSEPDQYMKPYHIHHIKYNKEGLILEDLRNFVDGMSGWIYEYEMNKAAQIIGITKSRVWSYSGLDHEIPTMEDMDQRAVHTIWKFEYDENAKLKKEIRTEKWMGEGNVYEFIYNEKGLIAQETSDDERVVYTYNEQGLVLEASHYHIPDPKKCYKRLRFEYVFF